MAQNGNRSTDDPYLCPHCNVSLDETKIKMQAAQALLDSDRDGGDVTLSELTCTSCGGEFEGDVWVDIRLSGEVFWPVSG